MPRNVTVTLADGSKHTYRNVPDSVTPDQIEQRAAKDYGGQRVTAISGGRKARKAAPKDESALRALGLGALRSLDVAAEMANRIPGAQYIDRLGQALGMPSTQEAVAQRNAMLARNTRTGYQTAGRILGDIALTAPLMAGGGAAVAGLGRGVGSRGLQVLGEGLASGGIGAGRTAAQTAAMTRGARAAELALRSAGGAAAGAGGAALTGQDVGGGAVVGAGLPIVGSIVRRLGGPVVDLARMGKVKAGQIIREAFGKDLDAARAALASLAPDDQRLAMQALVDAGVEADVVAGLSQIAREEAPQAYRLADEAQAAAREQMLAGAAEGATATERRAASEAGRRGVSEATAPAREAALARANVAGYEVPRAERIAAAARQLADRITRSEVVPRMRGLEERAGEQAAIMGDMPAIFPSMEGIQKTRGIAGAAGERANRAIEQQIGLRDLGRDMEDRVAALAAEGMTPLSVVPIVQQLRSMASAAGTRADDLQRGTLTRLARKLEGLADANGVIDARDLYQLRKSGLNDIVDRLLGARAQPSSGTKDRAAGLLASVRPMIDDAIEAAGGAGWKDYLETARQGFQAVNAQELTAKATQLAKEKPNEFLALMAGERPDIVEGVMGKGAGNFDVQSLATLAPQRWQALTQAADELQRGARIEQLAKSGAPKAREIMVKERPNLLARGLTGMALFGSPAARIGATGTEMAMSALQAPATRQEIGNAFLSGRNLAKAANVFPTSARVSAAVSRLPAPVRNVMAQDIRLGLTGEEDPVQAVFDDGSFATASGRQYDARGYLTYDPFAPAR